MINAITTGLTTEACVDEHVARVMRSKFEAGLFENAYVDIDAVLSLIATEDYAKELWKIEDNAQLEAARNPEVVAMEKQLMAESTVLIKNQDNLLPFAAGIKVYVTGNSDATAEKDREAVAGYAEVAETLEEADVAVARLTMINDAAELIVEEVYNPYAGSNETVANVLNTAQAGVPFRCTACSGMKAMPTGSSRFLSMTMIT